MTQLKRRIFRSVSALIVVLLLSAGAINTVPVNGQDNRESPASRVERKNRAPVSKELMPVKTPRPFEVVLENGLTVLIIEDHRFPSVSLQFHINGVGALYEPTELTGLARTTAQMLRFGTKNRNGKDISEDLDKLGANMLVTANFGSPSIELDANGLSDNFDQWFAIALDTLLNPTFPQNGFNSLKQQLKVQLRQQRSAAAFLSVERFHQAIYHNHPAANVSPTAASLDAITPAIMMKWIERASPQNTILAIVGDVDPQQLLPKLKRSLSDWHNSNLKLWQPVDPEPIAKRKIYLIDRPNSVQTTLVMGNIVMSRLDPDYIPMLVMNRIIGGGSSARLFLNLREEKGYTYGVYSTLAASKYPGSWRAGGDVRAEVTEPAIAEFFNEIRRIGNEKVTAEELEDNKRAIAAGFALSLENPEQLLNYAIIKKNYQLPDDYWDKYPAKVLAVSADDVQRVAKKYLNLDAIQIVAVGNAEKIKSALAKYGEVEVYDLDGRPRVK